MKCTPIIEMPLYACMLLIMPDAGLASNASVTIGISRGISYQMPIA